MTRLYVSNKNESVPMFQSRFMEFFSHVHPATPLVLYLPVIAYFLYQALWQRGLSIPFVLVLFAFGILIWTLLEYVIHRYAFHYEPKSRWGKFLVFGYVCYDAIHYAIHHFAMKRGIWLRLKQYHLRHHYHDDHAGFGVSSPLWDYVFRTTRK